MYILKVVFLIVFFYSGLCFTDSFVYPVAQLDNEKIFLIYQKSITQLELWIWDWQKKYAFKGLPNYMLPAGFRLLPSGKGFSFIDQGRIKIKNFGRRSPKSIDISKPIYDISLVEWISDRACYLSARDSTSYYGIYHLYDSGTVIPLICNTQADSMYPQKQNNTLFYIERYWSKSGIRNDYHYRILRTAYPLLPTEELINFDTLLFQDPLEHEVNTVSLPSIVVDNYKNPLIFLRMHSEEEGYVIEHQETIHEDDDCIECVYHHLLYTEGRWQMTPLFCFSLPVDILFNRTTRLYESIIPLLPYHTGPKIYYVDCIHAQNQLKLNIFLYNIDTKKQTQITYSEESQSHYFGLCSQGNAVFYGGSLENRLCEPPHCAPSSEGFFTFNLGRIS